MIKMSYDAHDRPIVVDENGYQIAIGDPFSGKWVLCMHITMNPVDAACYAYWFAFLKPKGRQGMQEYIRVVNIKRPIFKVEAHQ